MARNNDWIEEIINEVEETEAMASEERSFDLDYVYGGGHHYYDETIEDEENGKIYYD